MTDNKLLSVAILNTRDGDIGGFEDLFLLTYKQTYQDISTSVKDEEYIWNIIRDVYVQVYDRSANMPEASLMRPWLRILIKDVSKNKGGISITEFSDKEVIFDDKNIESKAATTLIKIEDQLGLIETDADFEKSSKTHKNSKNLQINNDNKKPPNKIIDNKKNDSKDIKAVVFSILMAAFAIAIAVLAVVIVIHVADMVKKNTVLTNLDVPGISTTTAEEIVVINSEQKETISDKFGWNESDAGKTFKKPDGTYISSDWLEYAGNLYYFDIDGYMVYGNKTIDKQIYIFSGTGELISISRSFEAETENTILSQQMEQFNDTDQISDIVADSIKSDSGWIYYLSKDADTTTFPLLLRYKNGVGQTEMIADEIQGYIIVGDDVWYCRDSKMYSFLKTDVATKITDGYQVVLADKAFYLQDGFGRNIKGNDGIETIDGRIYRIDNGLIKYVKPGTQSISGISWKLNSSKVDNKLYSSDGSAYLEQGIAINSFCVVDKDIYYSAIVSLDDNKNAMSQIFKINIDTGVRSDMSGVFLGAMLNMYYYKDEGSIYMEYATQPLSSAYGGIAIMSLSGALYKIDDSSVRNTGWGNGNDMLELLMVKDGSIYCYWHNCSSNGAGSSLKVLATKPIKLDDNARTGF